MFGDYYTDSTCDQKIRNDAYSYAMVRIHLPRQKAHNFENTSFRHKREGIFERTAALKPIFAVTPSHICNAQIAIAACRAGQVGILDLGTIDSATTQKAMVGKLAKFAGHAGFWGVRWDTLGYESRNPGVVKDIVSERIRILVLAGLAKENMRDALSQGRRIADNVIAEVVTKEGALAAQAVGFDGVVLKGNEAGGAVSPQTSFLLLQQLYNTLTIPYWIQGGISFYTAPATLVAGARGVVLCEQLWLMDEAPFAEQERDVWRRLDGSETVVIGRDQKLFRFFKRSGKTQLQELRWGRWCRQIVGQD